MLKCPNCKRQTNLNEPTGRFNTMIYKDSNDKSKGKRIFKSEQVCMKCNGELLK